LFPHHLVLSDTGSILQVGPTLAALLPKLQRGVAVERLFALYQPTSDQAIRSEGRVHVGELALHDGFEILARTVAEEHPVELRYRVHAQAGSEEIWLLDTFGSTSTDETPADRQTTLAQPMSAEEGATGPNGYFAALRAMAGGLSHELNNLLMGILGNTELLGLSIDQPSPRQHSMIDEIRGSADRAARLCDQLQLFSGDKQSFKEQIDGARFLDTLSIGESGATLDPTITVRIEMARPWPKLFGDAVQLRQLTRELIRNAIEASDRGATVTVRLGEVPLPAGESPDARQPDGAETVSKHITTWTGDYTSSGRASYLEVTDQGHGMCQAVLDRALDPFFSTRFLGRGLGLSSVLGITRAHGGAMTIQSTPGIGTRVRVLLPQTAADSTTAASSEVR
jgi:signal transduction histidine kinase